MGPFSTQVGSSMVASSSTDYQQHKWATSMVASSSTDYQESMPVDVDRVQDVKGKGKKGNHWAKLTMPKEKERKEKENSRNERKMSIRAQAKAKTRCGDLFKGLLTLERPRAEGRARGFGAGVRLLLSLDPATCA